MRKLISQNIALFERFERIENRLTIHDKNFNTLFKALEDKNNIPVQNIFFDGQIYDAYSFVNDLLKLAKSEIVLIDNYIDDTVFTLFSKYPNINFTIYTSTISKQLKLDFEKYSKQYKNISLKTFKNAHDRFLIIDKKEIYHLGASLKDLGKKWFAFSKIPLHSLNHHSFHFELDCKKSWDLLYSMSIKKWENENNMVAPLFVDKNIIRKISLRDR